MGLRFGIKVNDERDGLWKEDSALQGVTPGALADWEKDGSAAHLLPYAKNGEPTLLKFRPLFIDEARFVQRNLVAGSFNLVLMECFAYGVRFPSAPEDFTTPDGIKVRTMSTDAAGFRRLSKQFLGFLDKEYPGMLDFYGYLIFIGTFPTEPEKKASSPQSIATPSSVETATTATTAEPSTPAQAA